MDKRRSYVGQLYRGEPQTKSWSQVVSGHVTIRLVEGDGTPGEWKLAAYRKEKVWECKLNPGIKFRVKNDFVQWQTKGGGGETVTYGIRLKDQEAAAQLSDKIGEVLNALLSKAPEGDEVQVRVLCSVRDPSLLTVRSSTTMLQLLRIYCHKKQMDSSQFIIALPPDSPHPPVKPSTIVASLKTREVQVIKKGPKPPPSAPPPAPPTTTPPTESTDGSGLGPFEQLLQVELPRDERTVVRVSSLMTIAELLKYICEKRNLDVADHRFDLPATEESLAGKTLEQLKIKAIRVVLREGAKRREEQPSPVIETRSPSRSKRKSTKRNALDTGNESPKFNRRQAPPPPPPLQSRRTQPNLIKELSVTAEKKATLRRVGLNSDPECTPPEARHAHSIGNSYPPIAAPRRDTGSECSTEGTPEQEKKAKVPLLPNTARMGLHPPSVQPPCPPSKTTPTAETTHGEEPPLKAPAPPPVAEKPKKKRLKSFEEVDGQDSAPQAPPIKPKEEESAAIQTIDMDALMDEAIATEPAVKKVKKKVKRKQTSEDSTADGQKEKKTKSGKTTKKKKKVVKTMEGLPREESAERDDEDTPLTHPLQDGPDPSSPPPALSSEEVPREPLSEVGQTDQPPPSTSISVKPAIPDLKQKHASLKRRPRGPAPPPPPPGSKTMTLGRIRDGDVIVKSRGFTLNGMEVESGRLTTDEVVTKPRSISEALPPERVTASPSQVGTRPRPNRKAPSRPAPSTPQGREKARIDEGKSQVDQKSEVETKRRSGSLSGSPRRPPPTVPKNVSPVIPPAHNAAAADDSSPASSKEADIYDGNLSRGSNESTSGKDEETSPSATTPNLPTSKPPPSTPPKPASPRQPYPRQSPGESPSGRRRDAATVICKDTEDGGKELIVKPSPNSKRKLAGPLIFKMPPPPSTPPNKSKTKKPPKLAKPERLLGKKEDTGSAAAAVNTEDNKNIDLESADSSFGESISDTSGLEKVCSPKSLNDTLVSNEFTNLDELLSDSQQDIVTTDFSIEENLEPVDECGEELEWNDSGLADSGIPCHDPELETMTDLHCQGNGLSDNAAAALNINSNNNNNNNLGADDVFDYRDLPPPVDVPPPPPGDESDEWEWDSNRTGELNFDSSSSDDEVSKHRDDDGDIALDEEEGPGGVVLLNVKKVEDDVPVLPEEDKQDEQTRETGLTASNIEGTTHLVPASIPRDPSIGAQLSELDDVVSTLAELAAEVPVEAPPSPPPPPPPSLPASSHPGPLTSSTPTHKKEEHGRLSPEPPPIPQTLPPPLTPSDDDDDDFPLGPPPPLVTSEPPSLTPSPPSSPVTDRRAADTREEEEDEDGEDMANNEVLNRLKQRRIKPSSTWRRKRGSRDNSADDGGENELLEKLKERQAKYKSKAKVRREETTEPVSASDTSSLQSSSSIPGSASGMGTGSGGDNVQIQLQFLQQQVLQQQMLQLQQQFQQMQNYALQQGVSMPANLMMPGGAMLSQQSGFVTTPMAPPTGTGAQQVVMQTSAGPVLVPAASVPQMVPGQLPGVVTHPQVPVMPQGQLPQPSLHGQAIPPNITMPPSQLQQQQGQGGGSQLPLPAQPPLMSTLVTTSDKTTAPASRPGNQDTLTGGPDPLVSRPGDGGTCKSSAETRPGTDSSLVTPSRLGNKRRSEDVRALVLGPLEEQFDSLMDQVRDANPTAVLKKIPEDAGDEEKEPSSSYTGMAAALAEALKQRRLHVADKRRSLGELDESAQSNSSEWQSP